MEPHASPTFNLIEGIIWLVFAILLPLLFHQQTTRAEKIGLFLAFVGFGVSDFLEIQTGAWWRPWWLFGLKAICLGSIVWLMWRVCTAVFTQSKNNP